ncbi:hypothetical protein B0H19DRAFT_1264453 [Mycena capillaripes]|nr:hypothetical protein B0H19DRAFT_1264453 [Mycena capillaripes]
MLSEFPTELIHEISRRLEIKDLLILCRTSRQIHAICLEWIYRAISLKSPVQVLKWCETIRSRKEAADAVRELEILLYSKYPNVLKSFCTTFESAIIRMKNLQAMKVTARPLFQILSRMSFPRLLHCILPASLDIFPFLCKNPSITYISIVPTEEGSLEAFDASPLQSIYMPNMQRFDGPDIAACSVLPDSLVSYVGIIWSRKLDVDFSRALAAAGSAKTGIVQLKNMLFSWNPALPAAIAKHTPQIRFLEIRNIATFAATPEKEIFLSALDDTLRCLPCVMGICIVEGNPNPSYCRPIDRIEDDLESEFETVQRWGGISPTLTRIVLSNTASSWGRLYDDIWLPGEIGKYCPETVECSKWLIKKVLTSPKLPLGYRCCADFVGGKDGMKILEEAVKRDGVVPAFAILNKNGQTVISFASDT